MKVDLHTHSNYSDGTLDPEELIQKAHDLGISHLALCDHDSTGGLETARAKATGLNMTLISGIEINTSETSSVHILGYFIDEKSEDLQKTLRDHREIRAKRSEMILERLRQMGIKIHLSDFGGRKETASIGRPHIADKLKEKGVVFSRQEAFEKYLAKGKSAYAFYEGPTPQRAIEIILQAKGVPVVAHPGFFVSKEMMDNLVKLGLQGIETYYPTHRPDQIKWFLDLAKSRDLVVTGGSDYHGPGSGHELLGQVPVPAEVVDRIWERKQKLFG
ncbi:MAG: PHP domain-containing protein [Elusimicrobia bacterium]|nr:PHP domain-containing protein [Elusimicrobiota bacterium]